MSLRGLFGRTKPAKASAIPPGWVVYAIGDIHGRLDLLRLLVSEIQRDHASHPSGAQGLIVLLGDYIDRGPASSEVLSDILTLEARIGLTVRALKGNHEQAILAFLADPITGSPWLLHGGNETLISYGVALPRQANPIELSDARASLAEALPEAHLAFLQGLKTLLAFGDYIFVHAGLRPGVPVQEQSEHDLLWIRDDFLRRPWTGDQVVVHGHTPVEEVEINARRVGVDTGAFATGILTALRLEGASRALLQVSVGGPAA
ncbi:metallophosphoesterase family protein [soil metagenome]